MKLIVDINDNEYEGIKRYPDNITSYPVTIHLYDAVRNGTPLDKIITDLESLREPTEPHLVDYRYHRNDMLDMVLGVIDKYRNEVSS